MIERGACTVCDWPSDLVEGACEQCWRERVERLSKPGTGYPTGPLRDRMRDEAAAALAELEAADEARP